jgi:tetratricopeptide (TPR) repeat protein
MSKKNIILGAIAFVILAAGFAAGYHAQKIDYEGLYNQFKQPEVSVNTTPNITPPETTAPVLDNFVLYVDTTWPESQSATNYWRDINAKNIGQKLDEASVKSALDTVKKLIAEDKTYEARNKIEQLLQINAKSASLWLIFADISRQSNENGQALQAYMIAEALHPTQDEKKSIYVGMAAIYGAQNNEAAEKYQITALEKALEIKPDVEIQKQLDFLRGKNLKIENFTIRTESDTPEACFKFSFALQDDGSVRYEDYLTSTTNI